MIIKYKCKILNNHLILVKLLANLLIIYIKKLNLHLLYIILKFQIHFLLLLRIKKLISLVHLKLKLDICHRTLFSFYFLILFHHLCILKLFTVFNLYWTFLIFIVKNINIYYQRFQINLYIILIKLIIL